MNKPQGKKRKRKSAQLDGTEATEQLEIEKLIVLARSWFATFDDPRTLAPLAEHAQTLLKAARDASKAAIEAQQLNARNAAREQQLAIRTAALEVLFDLPGLLRRPDLFSHPAFKFVIDQLFMICQQRDTEAIRRFVHRDSGAPEQRAEALATFRLVVRGMSAHEPFIERLRDQAANGSSTAQVRLDDLERRQLTLTMVINEVAAIEGLSVEGVRSRIRKASTFPEVTAAERGLVARGTRGRPRKRAR